MAVTTVPERNIQPGIRTIPFTIPAGFTSATIKLTSASDWVNDGRTLFVQIDRFDQATQQFVPMVSTTFRVGLDFAKDGSLPAVGCSLQGISGDAQLTLNASARVTVGAAITVI